MNKINRLSNQTSKLNVKSKILIKSAVSRIRQALFLPISIIFISSALLSGCGKGEQPSPPPPPPVNTTPGKPIVAPITSPGTNAISVSWSTNGGAPGAYWQLKNQNNELYKSPVHSSNDISADQQTISSVAPGNYNFVVSLCNTENTCTDSDPQPFIVSSMPGDITAQIQEKDGKLAVNWSMATGNAGVTWMVLDHGDKTRPLYGSDQFDTNPVAGAVQSANTQFLIHNGSYSLNVMVCNGQGDNQLCSQSATQTISVTDSNKNTQPFFTGYFPSTADSFYNAYLADNATPKSISQIQDISLLAGGIPDYITQVVLSYATPNLLNKYTGLSHSAGDLNKVGLAFKADSASVQQAALALRQKNPGVQILLAVGGANNNSNWAGFSDADATGLTNLVKDLGLDGVYIDYQAPGVTTDDITAYYNVIAKIRSKLNAVSVPANTPLLILGGSATGADCTQQALNAGICKGAVSYWTNGNAGRERMLFALHPDVSGMLSEIAIASFNSGVDHYDPMTAYSDFARIAPSLPLAIGLTQAPETSPNDDPAAILTVTGPQNQCSANQIKQNQYGQSPNNGNAYSVDRFAQALSAGDGVMLWSMFIDDSQVPECGGDAHAVTDIAQGVSKDLGLGKDMSTVINKATADQYGVTVKWTNSSLSQQTSDGANPLRINLYSSPALVTTYKNGAPMDTGDTYQFATNTTGWSIGSDGHTLVSATPITTAKEVSVTLTAYSTTANPGAVAQGGDGAQQNVSFKVVMSSPALTWNTQASIPTQSSDAATPVKVNLNTLALLSTEGVPNDTYDFAVQSGGAGWQIAADKQTLTSNNIILDPQTVPNLVLQATSRTNKDWVSSNSPPFSFAVNVPYAVKWSNNTIPTQSSSGGNISIDLTSLPSPLVMTYQNGAPVQRDTYQFSTESGTDSGWQIAGDGHTLTGPTITTLTHVTVVLKANSTQVKPGLYAQNGNGRGDPTQQILTFTVNVLPPPPPSSGGPVIGYLQTYPRNNLAPKPGTWTPPDASTLKNAGYTQVNLSFVLFYQKAKDPNKQKIIPTFSVDNPWNTGNAQNNWKTYIQNLRSAGIKVLFSVGGAGCSEEYYPGCTPNFNLSVQNRQDATDLLNTLKNLVTDPTYGGFDGLDFDIEHGISTNGNTFNQSLNGGDNDVGNLAYIINQLRAWNPSLIITMAPQMANVAPTSRYTDVDNIGYSLYSSVIMQTCGNVNFVGVQLYNGGSDYSINTKNKNTPEACGLIEETTNTTTNPAVNLITGLLEDWTAHSCKVEGNPINAFTNKNPDTGKPCLTANQIILGYPSANHGGVGDGGPVGDVNNIKNSILCMRTGGAEGCTPGMGNGDKGNINNPILPLGKYNVGGVFDWDIFNDQDNNFAFASGLSACVQNVSGDNSACRLLPKPVATASVDYSTPGSVPVTVSFTATVQAGQGSGTQWSVLSDGVIVPNASNLIPNNSGNIQSGTVNNLTLSITDNGSPHAIVVKLCDNKGNCAASEPYLLEIHDNDQARLGVATIDTLKQGTGSNNSSVNLTWHADLVSPQTQANKWSIWENGSKVGNDHTDFDLNTSSQQVGSASITGLTIGSTHTYVVQLCSNNTSISCTNSAPRTVTLVNTPGKPVFINTQPTYNYGPAVPPATVSVTVGWNAPAPTGTNWFVLADGTSSDRVIYKTPQSGNYSAGQVNVNLANGAHTLYVALCNAADYVQDSNICTLGDPFTLRVGPDVNHLPAPVSALETYYYGQSTVDVSKSPNLPVTWRFYGPYNKPTDQSNTAQSWNVIIYTSSAASPALISSDYTTFGTNNGYQQDGQTVSSGSGPILNVASLSNGTYKGIVQLCNTNSAQQKFCIDNRDKTGAGGPITFTVTGGADYPTPNPNTLTMAKLEFTDAEKRTVAVKLDAEWTSTPVTKGSYWKLTDDHNGNQLTLTNNTFGEKDGPNQQTADFDILLSGVGDHTLTAYLCNGNPGVKDVCSVQKGLETINLPSLPAPGAATITNVTTHTPQNGQLATLAWSVSGSNPVGGNRWQLRDSTNPTDTGNSTLVASYTISAGDSGTSANVTNVPIPNGDHYLFIRLCNADDICTDGLTQAVTTSGAPLKRVISAYYSDWGTYNPYLRHGAATGKITPADTYGDAPYGFSGVQYQDRANNIHTMGQNNDAESAVKNLDIVYYAFMEAYPANSVTWDEKQCKWVKYQSGYPYDPTDSNSKDKQYQNNGTLFFFDPWSDIYADNTKQAIDTMCNFNAVKNDKPTNGSQEGMLHILCLAGYETGPQWATKGNQIPLPVASMDQDTYLWYFRFGNFSQFVKQQNTCNGTDPNCTPLKHLIAVGGWGHEDSFEAGAFVNPQNFANSIVNLMNLVSTTIKTPTTPASLDGVDLDYEPNLYCNKQLIRYTAANATKLVNLAKTVRNTFDAQFPNEHKMITAAMYANSKELKEFDNDNGDCLQDGQCNLRKYAAQLDYISLMGYDFHGPWDTSSNSHTGDAGQPGPALSQSNLAANGFDDYSVQAAVKTLIDAGVPGSKIIVGVPSYARVDTGFSQEGGDGRGQTFKVQNVPSTNGTAVDNPIYLGDLDSPKDPTIAQGQQSYYSIMLPTKGYNPKDNSNYTSPAWLDNFGFAKTPYSYSNGGVLSENWLFTTNAPPNPTGSNNATNNKPIAGTNNGAFVTFDTVDLVATKADYVINNGLGGMMMWEMMSDTAPKQDNADHSLLCAMYQKLHSVGQCQY